MFSYFPLYYFLVALIVLLLLVRYHWARRFLYFFSNQLPGPPAWPFVGNGLEFQCKKNEILNVILKLTDPYSSPSRLWLGPQLVVFVKDPNQLQIILQSQKIATKSFLYRFLEPFLGRGLFTSSGETHRNHRKLFNPCFSPKALEGYSYLFQKHALKLVEDLKREVDGPQFDILHNLHNFAFNATMDILFENKTNFIDFKEVPHFIRRFYNIFFKRVSSFWLHPDLIYKTTKLYQEQATMKKLATKITQELMETQVPGILKRLENHNLKPYEDLRSPSMLEVIIEMLIKDPNCLTEQDCIDHMMTFMATSQDTQSSAIAFTCLLLGMHPETQNRAVSELLQVLGGRKEVDMEDTSKLKYLEMCLKEAMRLFPVAPFLFRDTTEDFVLDKWTIPENVTVALGVFNVHRDAKFWEKPLEFYPEHFLPEAVNKRHPFAYIPFSGGPRKCIAQQYSFVNMKIIMGAILLNYVLETEGTLNELQIETDVSVRPSKGYLLKIRNRS